MQWHFAHSPDVFETEDTGSLLTRWLKDALESASNQTLPSFKLNEHGELIRADTAFKSTLINALNDALPLKNTEALNYLQKHSREIGGNILIDKYLNIQTYVNAAIFHLLGPVSPGMQEFLTYYRAQTTPGRAKRDLRAARQQELAYSKTWAAAASNLWSEFTRYWKSFNNLGVK